MSATFPTLAVCIGTINNVVVERENEKIRQLKHAVYAEVRAKYNIERLKEHPVVRAYRDFYWKLGIDPTKTRPSGEALLRRVLHGGELPTISTAVDAYNLASMKTVIPMSGFDMDALNPPFSVRFAEKGEPFTGIGMDKPLALESNMLVLADTKRVLCVYPHKDADQTKITEKTKRVLLVGYGAPGITVQQLEEAVRTALDYIMAACGGETQTVKVFSPTPKQVLGVC
ncbi:MAG: phenylalanine--tRNA ligase beta subunit-related protein [Candidatus Bathyarchaeota archaeon]|nr:phenylalanine--tRNA ligase beta subunit-related protein [Candidatus Bathyarchaeota archaeon]MDW8040086.1 phenylalanine--tRNA ligase beta subunit-related protein [Nitrososphaerota archaeon]